MVVLIKGGIGAEWVAKGDSQDSAPKAAPKAPSLGFARSAKKIGREVFAAKKLEKLRRQGGGTAKKSTSCHPALPRKLYVRVSIWLDAVDLERSKELEQAG